MRVRVCVSKPHTQHKHTHTPCNTHAHLTTHTHTCTCARTCDQTGRHSARTSQARSPDWAAPPPCGSSAPEVRRTLRPGLMINLPTRASQPPLTATFDHFVPSSSAQNNKRKFPQNPFRKRNKDIGFADDFCKMEKKLRESFVEFSQKNKKF